MRSEGDGDLANFMAALTSSACERHITNISRTPARARLSKVQSRSGALQVGSRH